MKRKLLLKPLPTVGSVYAIPLKNNQWGLCQIIDSDEEEHAVLGMAFEFVSERKPLISDVDKLKVLITTFASHSGKPEIIWDRWLKFIDTFSFIGVSNLGKEKSKLAQEYRNSFGSLESFNFSIPAQWYWDHDSTAYEKFKKEIDEQQEKERQEMMNKSNQKDEMTWDDLLKKDWFNEWNELVEKQLIEDSRRIIIATILKFKKLSKINKQDVKKIINEAVLKFNDLDDRNDNFINTIEREDICEAFSEIGMAIKGEEVDEIVDERRDW